MRLSEGSGKITADGCVVKGKVAITLLHISGDGSNDATIAAYDADNSGDAADDNHIATLVANATRNQQDEKIVWTFPRKCANGIYLDITGTGAFATVEWIRLGPENPNDARIDPK